MLSFIPDGYCNYTANTLTPPAATTAAAGTATTAAATGVATTAVAAAPLNSLDMSEIIPNLFLGSIDAAEESQAQFAYIVKVTNSAYKSPIRTARILDLDTRGGTPIQTLRQLIGPTSKPNTTFASPQESWFDETLSKIKSHLDKQEKVLVHCDMGVVRSATLVALYLVRKEKMSDEAAMKLLKEKRPNVDGVSVPVALLLHTTFIAEQRKTATSN
jgi:predicted protein tyrosine phosphatase